MKSVPTIKNIIKNDIGVFMCTIPPILFAALFTFLFVKNEIIKDQYNLLESTYISITIFLSLSLFLWPFVLWWWHSINQTFKTGIEIIASGKKMNSKIILGLGIEYSFEHNGNKIKHVASLVSNKKTKEIAKNESFKIMYNPEKNISFIKDAYI